MDKGARIALVTGAARGIGAEAARRLGVAGHALLILDLAGSEAEAEFVTGAILDVTGGQFMP